MVHGRGDSIPSQEPERKGVQRNEQHDVDAPCRKGNNLPLVSVNKGAKSFPVFITTFTVVDKETKEKIKYDDYRQMTEQDRERYNVYPKLSVYNVFNVEGQTNLKEA